MWECCCQTVGRQTGNHGTTFCLTRPKITKGSKTSSGSTLKLKLVLIALMTIDDCLMTVWYLLDDCLMISWRLSWLPQDCLMTSLRLPDDCLMNAWWLPEYCLMTAWGLIDNCLTTAMTTWRRPDHDFKVCLKPKNYNCNIASAQESNMCFNHNQDAQDAYKLTFLKLRINRP